MNIAKMMQQATKMQNDMKALQEQLKTTEVSHSVSGVSITMNAGNGKLSALTVDAALLDPSDKETFEDVMIAALNQTIDKKDALVADETQKIMGGLKLPAGFQLPF